MPVTIERTDDGFRLRCEQWLPLPVEEVFPFFSDAANLQRITPPHLSFEVLTPQPIEMREGVLIDYRLRLRGIPLRWQSRISAWEPNRRFIDEQRKGPYRKWVHEHRFEQADAGTLCLDSVDYDVPGGPAAPLINALFVRRDLTRIFEYRSRVLAEIFAPTGRRECAHS